MAAARDSRVMRKGRATNLWGLRKTTRLGVVPPSPMTESAARQRSRSYVASVSAVSSSRPHSSLNTDRDLESDPSLSAPRSHSGS